MHPKITEAVKAQLEYGSLHGTPTEQEVKLAELISKIVPSAVINGKKKFWKSCAQVNNLPFPLSIAKTKLQVKK